MRKTDINAPRTSGKTKTKFFWNSKLLVLFFYRIMNISFFASFLIK